MEFINKSLKKILDLELYPDIKVIESSPEPEVLINGKKVLLFCSSNYLGLATNHKLIDVAINSFKKYGTGSGGSRLLSGTYDVHIQLDKTVAKLKKSEDAMTFNSGFQTNFSVIQSIADPISFDIMSTIFKPKTIIFSDELNHASIIDGCRHSRAKVIVYKHNDTDDLENKLRRHKRARKMIITDGIFSMDGDIAKLDILVNLSKEYNALLYVDDAHATGVLGENGGGTAEHFHVQDKVDIQMGTFSKAVGTLGGYVAGSKRLIQYLRVASRSYVFSTAMPPAIAEIIRESLNIIHGNNSLRVNLFKNADYLRTGLRRIGYDTLTSETQIIPILIGNERKAIKCSEYLFKENILGPNVRWPAVAKNSSRVRFTVMSTHSKEQIDHLLNVCEKMKRDIVN